MSGLKPGPISEAGAKARRQKKKQIPGGNDRKKSKGKGKDQYRGLSTALRSGRDDEVWVEKQVPRCARNDSQKSKSKSKDKGKGNSNRNSNRNRNRNRNRNSKDNYRGPSLRSG